MAPRPVTGLALCAGAGGLELGLSLGFGYLGCDYRMVGAVERDAYAAACLVARMADETLDQAPVWDDLATFDGRAWRGRVDCISAGFPCQPFSQAGERRGLDDERWLWPLVARVVRDVGPSLVFLENVPALVVHGLPTVLGDLSTLGFDAEWECLSAAEVGAPHKRERFWLLAYRDEHGRTRLGPGPETDAWGDVDGSGGAPMADASGARREGTEGPSGRVPRPRDDRTGLADPDREARNVRTGNPLPTGPTVGPRIAGFPPRPDDTDGWADWIAEGGPEPSVRRDADGLASRLDRLHTIGNGVVPLVAAAAFVRLARRAGLVIGDSCEA